MATTSSRAKKSARPPTPKRPTKQQAKPTTILLVRHGQTPTTGKVLPGRAPGLHLAEHMRKIRSDLSIVLISGMGTPTAHDELQRAGIALNRKMLSQIAIEDPATFDKLVEIAEQNTVTTPAKAG